MGNDLETSEIFSVAVFCSQPKSGTDSLAHIRTEKKQRFKTVAIIRPFKIGTILLLRKQRTAIRINLPIKREIPYF
ncbi:MAG: hypothetical protein LBU22_13515 [Dysgonamonadaceae bacterium]|jgi:hypothetical protein|nr:hypothetical protein [Dysgonamonadaceae bacterium]